MYEVLFALTLIFVTAAILLLVAAQVSLPVIPFYLLAGILAGIAIDETQLLDLAQWGIAFLVFLFGVHVDVEAFRSTSQVSLIVGVLQASLVGVTVFFIGLIIGLSSLNAIYLGVAAALSSSLLATSYLDTNRSIRPTYERLAESIHFTEDLLGVLVVLGLSAFIYSATPAWAQVAIVALLFVAALFVRYVVFHRLTSRLQGDPEVMMLVGISFVIGFIAVAELAEVSIIIGAFAAGIAVADDYPHSLELIDTIDDLEDFFSPIFFITLGALLTLPSVESVAYTLVLVVAVLLVNPVIMAVILLRSGFDGRTAVLTGLTLDQVSAFSLFIAIEALIAEQIARPVFDAIILAAALTMFASAYTSRHTEQINHWLRDRGIIRKLGKSLGDRTHVTEGLNDHVILIGVAHGGHRALEACANMDRPVLLIEDNPEVLAEIHDKYDNYVYGDVLNEHIWEIARVQHAALIVSLTPEGARSESVVELETEVPRLVRVDDAETASEYIDNDTSSIVYPDAIAAEQVGEDIKLLLEQDISQEEFINRSRARFE